VSLGDPDIDSLTRTGFETTGACGLTSTFLPQALGAQSGWAVGTPSSTPWYAAAHSTLGSSLPASLLASTVTSYAMWTGGGSWHDESSTYSVQRQWQVASPYYLRGQPYTTESPCGDPGESPSAWYLDSDGDGYGDPDRSLVSCQAPSAYVDNGDDGDDTDAGVY
jgi:hypothetical protein